MAGRVLLLLIAFLIAMQPAAAERKRYRHEKKFEHYEGTVTCLECHEEEAESFFHSQHYQWLGETPQLVNGESGKFGKLNMINDFCTNPVPSWIGEARNAEGNVVARGCSGCHAGLGKMPSSEMSDEQLENIDCLICHAQGYRKSVYANEDGEWEWRPILWKNQEGLDAISKRISLPERSMCLRCHSASGGGPNWKRGDLEYTLKDPSHEFDVHMSSDGADMQCTDCHAGDDHRVIGRGADLAGTDMPDERLSCDSGCHNETVHEVPLLNRHAERVYCTTCHISEFARDEPTDMRRDWSKPSYDEEKGKFTATIRLEANVAPVYAWYNGTTWAQLPGKPVRRNADDAIMMAVPQGDRNDATAKIHAFKLHEGVLPVTRDTQWLLPIATEEFFAHGDIDAAVEDAAEKFYGLEAVEFDWAETIRFMGIYHAVPPASDALGCLDCHRANGRMDWSALGYESDPSDSLWRAEPSAGRR